jgi:hypothetical protein
MVHCQHVKAVMQTSLMESLSNTASDLPLSAATRSVNMQETIQRSPQPLYMIDESNSQCILASYFDGTDRVTIITREHDLRCMCCPPGQAWSCKHVQNFDSWLNNQVAEDKPDVFEGVGLRGANPLAAANNNDAHNTHPISSSKMPFPISNSETVRRSAGGVFTFTVSCRSFTGAHRVVPLVHHMLCVTCSKLTWSFLWQDSS